MVLSEKHKKNKDPTSILLLFTFVYQKVEMIFWLIRTFWYTGPAENNGKLQFQKRAIPLKDSSPDSKADFSEKSLLGVWALILGRYDIR